MGRGRRVLPEFRCGLAAFATAVLSGSLLVGCAEQGTGYKSNVYTIPLANQSQMTRNIEISAINSARFALGEDLVDGVQLTYTIQRVTVTSVQVGKPCEFQTGPALLISTAVNETRIQPNGKCGSGSATSVR